MTNRIHKSSICGPIQHRLKPPCYCPSCIRAIAAANHRRASVLEELQAIEETDRRRALILEYLDQIVRGELGNG